MTTTPHGQVPEALRLADELEIPIEGYPEATELERNAAAELRRLHAQVAALTAAPQGVAYAALPEKYYLAGGEVPTWDAKQMHAFADATHALRTTPVQNPAENEHVAGDVSKTGPESNMTQQPSPTLQADSQPAPEYVGNGMFKGETIEKAAEHWANWCDRRCMTGLSEFLRVVAARAPVDSVTAPAGGAEEVDKALNDYAQAFMARAMGWTRENGDAMPDARTKLYSAISSYARGLFTTPPTPQADSQPAATGRIAELEDALSSCLQLVNQLNEHHIPDGCSRLIRHIKDAAATVSKAQASAPADSVLEDAARLTTEQEYAIRQGHEIAASEAYFGARSKLDTNRNHNIFTAGFERGWDAARKQGGE